MVDEDYKRYYPYGSLASKVIGFAGGDNQGILGLEATYDSMLAGQDGSILTSTNARGIEIEGAVENRIEPVAGNTLKTSLDYNIQSVLFFGCQLAKVCTAGSRQSHESKKGKKCPYYYDESTGWADLCHGQSAGI